MPWKRKRGASWLNPDIQQQIDEVRAGRSTRLSLWSQIYGEEKLTEVPREIRALTGIQTLYLGNAAIDRFPSWLGELPNLKEINIGRAPIMALPSFLPNV